MGTVQNAKNASKMDNALKCKKFVTYGTLGQGNSLYYAQKRPGIYRDEQFFVNFIYPFVK